jgi:hypothetical protein
VEGPDDTEEFAFAADLWQWEHGSWFFVTLPLDLAADLRMDAGPPRGFGSIRVEVTIGGSVWRTSVFPHTESGSFVLPVKKAVRKAEDLEDGEPCSVVLRLVDTGG